MLKWYSSQALGFFSQKALFHYYLAAFQGSQPCIAKLFFLVLINIFGYAQKRLFSRLGTSFICYINIKGK